MGDASPVNEERGRSPLLQELALRDESLAYAILSLCDVIMTHIAFLKDMPWSGYESNPLARYFFRHWGMNGLVAFKFALVAVVLICCQLVYSKHPRLARGILIGGCVLTFYIVVKSVLEMWLFHAPIRLPGLG